MLIGYARVSTKDQSLDLQLDALNAAGCEKIFSDHGVSGVKTKRPGLDQTLEHLRQGDKLIVTSLDRLGRSISHLITTVTEFKDQGIEISSLKESIDTSTATGKLIFHLFAMLAEFERDQFKERSQAGMAAARARGKVGGRKFKLNSSQTAQLLRMFADRDISLGEICRTFSIGKTTIYRCVERAHAEQLKKVTI